MAPNLCAESWRFIQAHILQLRVHLIAPMLVHLGDADLRVHQESVFPGNA